VRYTVIIENGRESGYVAFCPILKGCVSQGTTKKESLANLKEAMSGYLEALIEDGLPIPTEVSKEYAELEVAVR